MTWIWHQGWGAQFTALAAGGLIWRKEDRQLDELCGCALVTLLLPTLEILSYEKSTHFSGEIIVCVDTKKQKILCGNTRACSEPFGVGRLLQEEYFLHSEGTERSSVIRGKVVSPPQRSILQHLGLIALISLQQNKGWSGPSCFCQTQQRKKSQALVTFQKTCLWHSDVCDHLVAHIWRVPRQLLLTRRNPQILTFVFCVELVYICCSEVATFTRYFLWMFVVL